MVGSPTTPWTIDRGSPFSMTPEAARNTPPFAAEVTAVAEPCDQSPTASSPSPAPSSVTAPRSIPRWPPRTPPVKGWGVPLPEAPGEGILVEKRQACEGFGIDTELHRRGVFDACAPGIAAFRDCKVWGETTPAGSLRHVFFCLPADVEAAHLPYDLIGVTFETETARFKTVLSDRTFPRDRREPEGHESRTRYFQADFVRA
jgi:hypothetical protein